MPVGSRYTLSGLLNPPFVVAVVLLGAAAVLAGPFASWMDFRQAKLALPLKSSLSALDVNAIAPFRVVDRRTFGREVVDALGTDQYLYWTLEDTSLPKNDPLRLATLFVSYYSGGRDLVPHTPDACYLGSGYEPAQRHENLVTHVPSLGPGESAVPIRVGTFMQTAVFDRRKHTVAYTFFCNGQFTATRSGVRLLINDPGNTYAYFSKVEVSFPAASRAEATEGVAKLFDRVLLVLIRDHWPDFEEAERAHRSPSGEGVCQPRVHA